MAEAPRGADLLPAAPQHTTLSSFVTAQLWLLLTPTRLKIASSGASVA